MLAIMISVILNNAAFPLHHSVAQYRNIAFLIHFRMTQLNLFYFLHIIKLFSVIEKKSLSSGWLAISTFTKITFEILWLIQILSCALQLHHRIMRERNVLSKKA